jgi:putative FmdB family regulatory protein
MPIYEYRCQSCGQVSEVLVHGFENGNPMCPNCGSHDLDKLLSVPSVLKENSHHSGSTCCGRTERCDKPPCSSGGKCVRD